MNRLYQCILIGSSVLLSWLGLMAFHELGHCLAAWLTGGTIVRLVLHPLAISRTCVWPNPHPLIVVWAGPVIGVLLPLIMSGVSAMGRLRTRYLFRFFAGFCCVLNGVYIAEDTLFMAGDSGDLIRHGVPQMMPIVAGLAALALGLHLWNGLGPNFGLAGTGGVVNRADAAGTLFALLAVMAAGLACGVR